MTIDNVSAIVLFLSIGLNVTAFIVWTRLIRTLRRHIAFYTSPDRGMIIPPGGKAEIMFTFDEHGIGYPIVTQDCPLCGGQGGQHGRDGYGNLCPSAVFGGECPCGGDHFASDHDHMTDETIDEYTDRMIQKQKERE